MRIAEGGLRRVDCLEWRVDGGGTLKFERRT